LPIQFKMDEMALQEEIAKRVELWKSDAFDQESHEAISILEKQPDELAEAFYKDLEFGTGGLRGLMGVGPNRMNRYTVGAATQGLANYILERASSPSVAIAYDSRNQSDFFAAVAADVLASNGITVYLFDELRPTPLLSFTVRELNCIGGIVITASHNPKEYNGYKVYWEDGGQLVPPHDKGIITEVRKVDSPVKVKNGLNSELVKAVPAKVEQAYYAMVEGLLKLPKDHVGKKELKILFTSLHGTGITMIPKALENAGFSNVHILASQASPDGNFPTVKSPNPEERSAMTLAMEEADRIQADIILGTDPDTDRVGMGVRNVKGEMELLNGNQAAALLIHYLLAVMRANGESFKGRFIAKTIVTSELLKEIADKEGVNCYDTLTGFKYIADLIRNLEGKERFIAGGEESYGYLIGDEVRDKDAVLSTVMLCEMAAWARGNSKSVRELLFQIYKEVGMYRESLISITKKGMRGAKEIQELMNGYRTSPPSEIAGSKVIRVADYLKSTDKDLKTGASVNIDLPSSNVIQLWLADGTKITARPSGTEPKIKYYVSVKAKAEADLESAWNTVGNRIAEIEKDLGL
jgi:phosphoglucomutase